MKNQTATTDAKTALTAKVTRRADGKIKLETFGRPDAPDDLRRLNWTLSNLRYCETYPIGCQRYFAESDENLTAAVDLLKIFGFQIEFYEAEEFQ